MIWDGAFAAPLGLTQDQLAPLTVTHASVSDAFQALTRHDFQMAVLFNQQYNKEWWQNSGVTDMSLSDDLYRILQNIHPVVPPLPLVLPSMPSAVPLVPPLPRSTLAMTGAEHAQSKNAASEEVKTATHTADDDAEKAAIAMVAAPTPNFRDIWQLLSAFEARFAQMKILSVEGDDLETAIFVKKAMVIVDQLKKHEDSIRGNNRCRAQALRHLDWRRPSNIFIELDAGEPNPRSSCFGVGGRPQR